MGSDNVAFHALGDMVLRVEFGDRADLTRTSGCSPWTTRSKSRRSQPRPGDSVRFRAADPDEPYDLHVACRAVGGGADLA